ncbi:hypothetical protein [Bradyrhizobium sp. SZCCHNR3015]|uniref:hypothetical protein n=1 Tax=Bradyrhizobium sp. SZCCHNR3015 TaxID=3057395 RepID=UPI0029165D80|nr:hypothetical protein [Bradyrhizobium sp. SZCCHNR3015]
MFKIQVGAVDTALGRINIPRDQLAEMKRDARSKQHARNGLNGGRAQERRRRQLEKQQAKAEWRQVLTPAEQDS